MTIEHFFLAHGSSIDQERNSLSIFDLFEDLQIQVNVPAITLPVQVIAVLKREMADVGELNQVYLLEGYSPSGERMFGQEFPIKLGAGQRRFRMRINMPLMVQRSGLYRIVFSAIGAPETSRETDLIVEMRQTPTRPPAGGPSIDIQ